MTLSEVRITLRKGEMSGCIRRRGFWQAWVSGRATTLKHTGRSKAEALGRCLLSLPDLPYCVVLDGPPKDGDADGEGGDE